LKGFNRSIQAVPLLNQTWTICSVGIERDRSTRGDTPTVRIPVPALQILIFGTFPIILVIIR